MVLLFTFFGDWSLKSGDIWFKLAMKKIITIIFESILTFLKI